MAYKRLSFAVGEVVQFSKCSVKVRIVKLHFTVHVCGADTGVLPGSGIIFSKGAV